MIPGKNTGNRLWKCIEISDMDFFYLILSTEFAATTN